MSILARTPTPADSPGSVARPPRSEPSIVNSLESCTRNARRARDIAEISAHREFLESTGVARYSLRLHARVVSNGLKSDFSIFL